MVVVSFVGEEGITITMIMVITIDGSKHGREGLDNLIVFKLVECQ